MREDSFLLANSAAVSRGEMVVEVGCGSGLASVAAARLGANVVATDVNPHALTAVGQLARKNFVDVDCVRADLLAGLRTFDVVLFNPPYLPDLGVDSKRDWHEVAVNGGKDGTEVLERFLGILPTHLKSRGRAYVVVAQLSNSKVDPLRLVRGSIGVSRVEIVGERMIEGEHLLVVALSRDDELAQEGPAVT